jgi:hypothetical protein
LTAEMMPMGTASTQLRKKVIKPRITVSASRSPINWPMGRRQSSDTPRSPRTMRPIHLPYCTVIGWSSPYCSRSASICTWSIDEPEAASSAM